MKDGLSEIVVLLDRSGSMSSIADDVIGGFNAFVEEQKKVAGDAVLTLVQFDGQDPHEVVHDRVNLTEIPPLTDDTYRPRGTTPLYDALGWTLDHIGQALEKVPEEERPEVVIFAILTDGLENCSTEYTKDGVFKQVQRQQGKYNWKFIYLGANQDAMIEAANLGIRHDANAENVQTFLATAEGVKDTMDMSSRSATHYRTGKSA